MKKEFDLFLTAVMFLTRIPVPSRINHNQLMLRDSVRYFPWVGILVGIITALVLFLVQFVFPFSLSVLFSMITGILLTGAFHEDGFADACDGFGGGWTKEKILLIMKDSRLGTHGVTGLISILGLKFIVLLELFRDTVDVGFMAIIIISAQSISRLITITLLLQYPYVTENNSKSEFVTIRKLTATDLFVAFAGGMLPVLFLKPVYLLALIPPVVLRIFLGKYFNKKIGGYTGDCLGALQQMAETGFYLSCFLVWKYI